MSKVKLKVLVTGILWDIDDGGEEPETQMILDNIRVEESDYLELKADSDAMQSLIEDAVSDAITEASGWCHTGFKIEKIEPSLTPKEQGVDSIVLAIANNAYESGDSELHIEKPPGERGDRVADMLAELLPELVAGCATAEETKATVCNELERIVEQVWQVSQAIANDSNHSIESAFQTN